MITHSFPNSIIDMADAFRNWCVHGPAPNETEMSNDEFQLLMDDEVVELSQIHICETLAEFRFSDRVLKLWFTKKLLDAVDSQLWRSVLLRHNPQMLLRFNGPDDRAKGRFAHVKNMRMKGVTYSGTVPSATWPANCAACQYIEMSEYVSKLEPVPVLPPLTFNQMRGCL